MTKQELQKELKAKVKPGVKPSQLKRSRSLGELPSNGSSFDNERHIPKVPPLPKSTPLVKSKSTERIESAPSSQLEQLEAKISVLELKLEISQRELTAKEAEKHILTDQLTLKQQELEEKRSSLDSLNKENQELRKKLETSPAQEFDHSLFARHQNLKS